MQIVRIYRAVFGSNASLTFITALGLIGAIIYTSTSFPLGAVILCAVIAVVGVITVWFQIRHALRKHKQDILAALSREYELSYGDPSAAMRAGLEPPPKEWTNRRLKELGESWQV